jgi:hypothetical protein
MAAFAFSKWETTSAKDLLKSATLPWFFQRVMCFDVSFITPQLGQMFFMLVSHRDPLLFDPHHPETCFTTNIQNISG